MFLIIGESKTCFLREISKAEGEWYKNTKLKLLQLAVIVFKIINGEKIYNFMETSWSVLDTQLPNKLQTGIDLYINENFRAKYIWD